jgi:peptidyl-tRNA hydrolase ICT1
MIKRACAKTGNRVNSKATLKVPLSALLPQVPSILHQDLRSSRYVADRTDALVIQSDEARKQSANVESCYEKLYRVVEKSARNVIPGETSVEQRDRVRDLYVLIYFCLNQIFMADNACRKKAETQARIKTKKMHSAKKSNRRNSKYED